MTPDGRPCLQDWHAIVQPASGLITTPGGHAEAWRRRWASPTSAQRCSGRRSRWRRCRGPGSPRWAACSRGSGCGPAAQSWEASRRAHACQYVQAAMADAKRPSHALAGRLAGLTTAAMGCLVLSGNSSTTCSQEKERRYAIWMHAPKGKRLLDPILFAGPSGHPAEAWSAVRAAMGTGCGMLAGMLCQLSCGSFCRHARSLCQHKGNISCAVTTRVSQHGPAKGSANFCLPVNDLIKSLATPIHGTSPGCHTLSALPVPVTEACARRPRLQRCGALTT